MDVCQISTPATAAVATMAKEVLAANEMQMAIMKSISDSQQQMAEMLRAAGIGQNLDVQA
jgi:poly-beta-hydroxyalkanoate depolymerase